MPSSRLIHSPSSKSPMREPSKPLDLKVLEDTQSEQPSQEVLTNVPDFDIKTLPNLDETELKEVLDIFKMFSFVRRIEKVTQEEMERFTELVSKAYTTNPLSLSIVTEYRHVRIGARSNITSIIDYDEFKKWWQSVHSFKPEVSNAHTELSIAPEKDISTPLVVDWSSTATTRQTVGGKKNVTIEQEPVDSVEELDDEDDLYKTEQDSVDGMSFHYGMEESEDEYPDPHKKEQDSVDGMSSPPWSEARRSTAGKSAPASYYQITANKRTRDEEDEEEEPHAAPVKYTKIDDRTARKIPSKKMQEQNEGAQSAAEGARQASHSLLLFILNVVEGGIPM